MNSSLNIDVLLDVPVSVSVELGACKMPMRTVLQLKAGSVVQLDRLADSPVDVLVNGKMIARGQVVVIDDRFGIKILELISGVAK